MMITQTHAHMHTHTHQEKSNAIRKYANGKNKHFSKEDIQMVSKYMKKSSMSLAPKEVQRLNCNNKSLYNYQNN